MIYLLISKAVNEHDHEELRRVLEDDSRVSSVYRHDPSVLPGGGVFLVSFTGAAFELSNLALKTDTETSKLGAVFRVSGHAGFAETELWDWIKTYGSS